MTKHTLHEPGDVPKEYNDWLLEHADGAFRLMERAGNNKEAVFGCLMILLEQMQEIVVKHADRLTMVENNKCSSAFVIICALLNVSFKNPLYGSSQLTDQLRHELRQLMQHSHAIEIHDPADD